MTRTSCRRLMPALILTGLAALPCGTALAGTDTDPACDPGSGPLNSCPHDDLPITALETLDTGRSTFRADVSPATVPDTFHLRECGAIRNAGWDACSYPHLISMDQCPPQRIEVKNCVRTACGTDDGLILVGCDGLPDPNGGGPPGTVKAHVKLPYTIPAGESASIYVGLISTDAAGGKTIADHWYDVDSVPSRSTACLETTLVSIPGQLHFIQLTIKEPEVAPKHLRERPRALMVTGETENHLLETVEDFSAGVYRVRHWPEGLFPPALPAEEVTCPIMP